jgi:NAD(P)-dependent dehydrogenase (short-subunit alcohol dehydrogenase family)
MRPPESATAADGRSALVTGASSGIGLAVVEMLLREGFAITAVARRPDKLAEATKALRAKGGVLFEHPANVANEQDVIGAVDGHRRRFGRLDLLVNNAGVSVPGEGASPKTARIDLQLNVNIRSVILFYRECLDLLLDTAVQSGSALVINVSSLTGRFPEPWLAVYSATKAAIVNYTVAMNAELGSKGIRSTAICPGFVDTAMSDGMEGVPAGEMIPSEDIAEVVQMLLRLSPNTVIPEVPMARPLSRYASGL